MTAIAGVGLILAGVGGLASCVSVLLRTLGAKP